MSESSTEKAGGRYWTAKVFAATGPLPVLIVLLVIFFQIANPTFLSLTNFRSVLSQGVFLLLIALAQTIVLITGGFDLSVGSNVALTSVTSSLVMASVYGGVAQYAGESLWCGLLVALAVGLAVGLANGIGVAVLKLNAFIVTLATASIIQGLTIVISGGSEIGGLPPSFTGQLGSGYVLGIVPVSMLIAIPIALILLLVLRRTRYGRSIYAIGGNPTAAKVAGVRVQTNLLIAYVIAGLLTSTAGWLLTARVASGQPNLGAEYVMESITAAIIGGAVLSGGRGGVGGTVLGVLFIMGLSNGMDLIRMDTNQQSIALGLALVLSILISRLRERARRTSAAIDIARANALADTSPRAATQAVTTKSSVS